MPAWRQLWRRPLRLNFDGKRYDSHRWLLLVLAQRSKAPSDVVRAAVAELVRSDRRSVLPAKDHAALVQASGSFRSLAMLSLELTDTYHDAEGAYSVTLSRAERHKMVLPPPLLAKYRSTVCADALITAAVLSDPLNEYEVASMMKDLCIALDISSTEVAKAIRSAARAT